MPSAMVVTDSTASLPEACYGAYGIVRVPYYVHLPQGARRDVVDLTAAELNAYLRALPDDAQLPKTANPGPGDYAAAFIQALEVVGEVISLHMTASGSGAYQAACIGRDLALAERQDARIAVVDTRNVSMAHGWLALECARAAQQGARLSELVDLARRLIPRAKMVQTADTLRYLYMGGRIGRAAHLVSAALNIKPLISMDDGVIVTLGVARSIKMALKRMVGLVERGLAAGEALRVAITHADALELAQNLEELIRESLPVAELLYCDLSPALAVHSGPGTVGLCVVPTQPG